MKKIFILVFLGLAHCIKVPYEPVRDDIKKVCIKHRTETRAVGATVSSVEVCDKYDFIYYDEDGIPWRIKFTKTDLWKL